MEDVVPWDYNGADKLFQPVGIVAILNSCNMALAYLWGCWLVWSSAYPQTHKHQAHSVLCVSWCLEINVCAIRLPEYCAFGVILACTPSESEVNCDSVVLWQWGLPVSSLPPLKPVRRSGHSRHGVHTVPEAHEVHVSECTHCQGMAAVAQRREALRDHGSL